jgi:hypothetical protein
MRLLARVREVYLDVMTTEVKMSKAFARIVQVVFALDVQLANIEIIILLT